MKDILVLATGSAEDEFRFAFAEKLAKSFDAGFDVVLANELPRPHVTTGLPLSSAAPAVDDAVAHQAARSVGAERFAQLEQRFAGLKPKVGIVRVDETASALGVAVADLARTHDTFVCSLPGRERDLEISGSILDRVLVAGGRSVVGLPQGFEHEDPIRTVAVAWNEGREAARAVAEAMPLLERAESVVVVLVDQLRRAGTEKRPGDDILNHLTRHGVKVRLARVASEEQKTSEAILSEAKRQNAELLVIGAQAEGGLLQWLQGSVSRDLVAKARIPLLMAH